MVRFLASTTLAIIGNALGLIVAAWVLDDMSLDGTGFVIALAIFSVAYIVMQPLSVKMALRYVQALAGGSALVATLLSLIITDVLADGLRIQGFTTWILATLIVWLVSVLAAVILPLFLFRKALGRATGAPNNAGTTWR